MVVIPAIDLYQGRVVRFTRGNPSSFRVYNNEPQEWAKKWEKLGAEYLHVVDLSSALGEADHGKIIKEILKETKIKVEIGGGIRDLEKAKQLISWGAERVIIGTKGLDEKFLKNLIVSLGREKIAVSVDVINQSVATQGWKEKTKIKGLDFIVWLQDKGIKWIIYTDILRDGTLKGPNLEAVKEIFLSLGEINLILSGGVSSLDDLKKIKKEASFIWGVIVGKALYEGKIDLSLAIPLLNG